MSTPDLWAKSGHDWHRLVVLPTLPVARSGGGSTFGAMTDAERRDRLAFAIRTAMGKRTAQDVAQAMEPKKSKETVARWARGDTVPSALDVGPLARALGVRVELLVDPPSVPTYPLSEYLLDAAASGVEEGLRRAQDSQAEPDPEQPDQSPARRPRGTATTRG